MASVEREDTSTSSFGRSILPSQWARPSLTPDPHSLRNPSMLFFSSRGLTKPARLLGRGFCTRTSLLEMCCLAPERFRLEVDLDPAFLKPRPDSSFRNADGMESFPTCKLHILYQHVLLQDNGWSPQFETSTLWFPQCFLLLGLRPV